MHCRKFLISLTVVFPLLVDSHGQTTRENDRSRGGTPSFVLQHDISDGQSYTRVAGRGLATVQFCTLTPRQANARGCNLKLGKAGFS